MQLKILIFLFFFFSYYNYFSQYKKTYHILEHNDISVPFNDQGLIGDTGLLYDGMTDPPNYTYKEKNIMYLSGFLLSGMNQEKLWLSGEVANFRIQDYNRGSYILSEFDSLAQIYVVRKDDLPFSESWKDWEKAVKLGADYYDGNKDGIYDPIDLNNNGIWDKDEDRPDLIGEETAWCVYKDNVPSEIRRFEDQKPMGIEIQQTVFVTNRTESFENTLFVRYKIINTGLISDDLDSVYFSIFADPDIGSGQDYTTDLIGCDTLLNAGFAYKNETSESFGDNPPCLLIDLLNGPISYIPNKTFIDENNSGNYDNGEYSIDSAHIIHGNILGTDYKLGAKNLSISSFSKPYFSVANPVDPQVIDYVNYILGKPWGIIINPCEWDLGKILKQNCDDINGKFLYSGDPVYLKGWISTDMRDQNFLLNTGPFKLKKDEPIEITAAYIIAQGNSSLESVKLAKIYSREIQFLYDNNDFEDEVLNFEEPAATNDGRWDFILLPNYPNPFNKETRIKFVLRNTGFVTLKLYNSLGEHVKTILAEEKVAGPWVIDFSAEDLSSGWYIVSLRQGAHVSSQKMIILK